jgi:NAD(P)-dependent dehydrogenase (short-subunit alcohol dehydrogenase family)
VTKFRLIGIAAVLVSVVKGVRSINMSSVNALLAIPSLATYTISKGGMKQLTSVAAVALAPHKIRVVAVGPGTILTDMVASAIFSSEDARRSVLSRTPIGRGGKPSEAPPLWRSWRARMLLISPAKPSIPTVAAWFLTTRCQSAIRIDDLVCKQLLSSKN